MGKPFRRLERWLRSLRAEVNERPVFVLGNQKSGTTAIAALLAAYAGASVTLDFFPYLTKRVLLEAFERPDGLERLIRRFRLEFSRDVVKEPHLTFLYPRLTERFPEADWVMVVRDPRDNIRSILDRVGLPGDRPGMAPGASELQGTTWPLVLDGAWLGLDGEDVIEMLALRWRAAASMAARTADRARIVRYEDFERDKERCIAHTARTLGLPEKGEIRDLLDVEFQPAGNRGVEWSRFFGPRNLRRIERICAAPMERFGYEPTTAR